MFNEDNVTHVIQNEYHHIHIYTYIKNKSCVSNKKQQSS